MTKSELIDLSMVMHAETEKAIRVSDDGDTTKAVWLPKSQVEVLPNSQDGTIIVTLPQWLAKDKGLI